MKCIFCEKEVKKIYKIKGKISCAICRDIYMIISRMPKTTKNKENILAIVGLATSNKHCLFCDYFYKHQKNRCSKNLSTGISSRPPSRQNGYPLSYANHGCTHFAITKKL